MNKSQKRIIKLAALAASICFALVTVGTATYAWFINNDRVKADGMNISAGSAGLEIDTTDLFVWQAQQNSDKFANRYSNKKTSYSSFENVAFNLPKYAADPSGMAGDKDYAWYTGAAIHIKLNFPTGFDTSKSEIVASFGATSSTNPTSGVMPSVLSNYVRIKSYAYSYTTFDDVTTKYHGASSYTRDTGYGYMDFGYMMYTKFPYYSSFVTKTSSTTLERTKDTLVINGDATTYQRCSVIAASDTVGSEDHMVKSLDFYVQMDWEKDFVDALVASSGTSLTTVDLTNDIKKLVISIAPKSGGLNSAGRYRKITSQSELVYDAYEDTHEKFIVGAYDSSAKMMRVFDINSASSNYRNVEAYNAYSIQDPYSVDDGCLAKFSDYTDNKFYIIYTDSDDSDHYLAHDSGTTGPDLYYRSAPGTDAEVKLDASARIYNTAYSTNFYLSYYSSQFTFYSSLSGAIAAQIYRYYSCASTAGSGSVLNV